MTPSPGPAQGMGKHWRVLWMVLWTYLTYLMAETGLQPVLGDGRLQVWVLGYLS